MTIDTNTMISISEANQNFQKLQDWWMSVVQQLF